MGFPELFYGIGAVVLLAVLIYAATAAGRHRHNPAADEATRRNFDKA